MTDNCQYEHLLIDHYIKMVVEKCQQQPKQSEIIRLPFSIYFQSTKIFKQENQILTYLITRIKELFYLQEFRNESSKESDEKKMVYLNLIFTMKSYKVVLMSQIIVRIVLLALTIHVGQKDMKIFKFKFSRLVQDLKIELILSSQSISDLIIKELQFMNESFNSLQYYEELKNIFEKLQMNKVTKWLQSVMEKKRNKFQIKTQTTIPYKLQSNNKINSKQTSNSAQQITSIDSKIIEQPKIVQPKGLSQNKMDKKQMRRSSPQNQRRVSTIVLANKLRKSIGVPTTRFSAKYTFKSIKKQSQQELVVYQQETELQCISIDKNQSCEFKKLSTNINKTALTAKQEESGLILCAATPPKAGRKLMMD